MPSKVKFETMRSAFFFTLIIVLSLALLYILRPFFYPLFWAAVIAVIFYPVFKGINKRIKLPSLSSIITIILIIVFLILPLALLGLLLVNESLNLYEKIASGEFLTGVKDFAAWIDKTPLKPYLEALRTEWQSYASTGAQTVAIFLFNNLKYITQNSVRFLIMFFLMLYTLYYFLKDGEKILNKIMYLSPLGNKYEKLLYQKFTSTSRATLKGTLIIGGIQGVMGGLTFWITGIDGALVWGAIMIILAIIPAVGPFLVWFPAGIVMLLFGQIWQGLTILIIGAFGISLIDNLLRPPLVGKDAELHPLIVLFSTLGGLLIFGISGFVIGPVVASMFLAMMSIYHHYYNQELQKN